MANSTVHPTYLSVSVHQTLKFIVKLVVFLKKNIIFLSFIIIMIKSYSLKAIKK